METIKSISNVIAPSLCDETTYQDFQRRLGEGLPTRDENPTSHFCVYFLPFDPSNKRVFIVHHKKSGLWISPGGHIDKGETLQKSLNREINEELGVKNFFREPPSPFLLTTTPIENRTLPCKKHYDIWVLVPTNGNDFNINPEEFHGTEWLTIAEAKEKVTDLANIKALEAVEIL